MYRDFLYRPGVDEFEIQNPIFRPGVDEFEVVPLGFLDQYLKDRGIVEQNQELSGPKEQVFPRFADPGDGTLSTTPMMMASNVPLLGDDGAGVMRAIRSGDINRIIPGYTDRRDRLRERIMGVLRGV